MRPPALGRLTRSCAQALIVTLVYTPVLSSRAMAQAQVSTTLFEYDAQGNLTKRTDPRGVVTTQSYDGLHRLIQQIQPTVAAGVPKSTMSYDGQDRPKSVTDPRNLVTSYTVNGLGDTTQLASPDTGTASLTFDAAGNVLTRLDARGKTVAYSYDGLNRLLLIDYPTGVDTAFEYDGGTVGAPNAKGRLTKITDESGITTYAYDGFGRVLTKTQTVGSASTAKVRTVSYGYGTTGSSTGKLISLTYPSGNRVNYSYNGNGQVLSMTLNPANNNGVGTNTAVTTPLLNNITYNPTSQVTGWEWGNHTVAAPSGVTRTYDLDGRLTSFPIGHSSQLGLIRTVVYDAASRITGYTHVNGSNVAQPAQDHAFGYDDLNRVTSWAQSTTSQAYSYDLTGNRLTQTIGATSYSYATPATSNRLTSTTGPVPAQTNTYDAAGNLLTNGTATFTYSDRGRMKTAKVGANTVTYVLNGLEQRTSKTGPTALVATGQALYAYDEHGQLLGEYDAALIAKYETAYLGSTPVAVLSQSVTGNGNNKTYTTSTHYAYADQIDTVRALARNSDNKLRWKWDNADPFGTAPPNNNPQALGAFTYHPRFPGQVYDSETNLHYNLNREYDPRLGRYIQSDPIGFNAGLNTFAYVDGDPITKTDPLGLMSFSTFANEKTGGMGSNGATCVDKKSCDEGYALNIKLCKQVRSPKGRALCYGQAAVAYAACLAGQL